MTTLEIILTTSLTLIVVGTAIFVWKGKTPKKATSAEPSPEPSPKLEEKPSPAPNPDPHLQDVIAKIREKYGEGVSVTAVSLDSTDGESPVLKTLLDTLTELKEQQQRNPYDGLMQRTRCRLSLVGADTQADVHRVMQEQLSSMEDRRLREELALWVNQKDLPANQAFMALIGVAINLLLNGELVNPYPGQLGQPLPGSLELDMATHMAMYVNDRMAAEIVRKKIGIPSFISDDELVSQLKLIESVKSKGPTGSYPSDSDTNNPPEAEKN